MNNKKILIVCESIHHGNTLKVAEAIASELRADVKRPSEVDKNSVKKYSLVGFGSGIYDDLHHKKIFDLVDALPKQDGKKAFTFSTSGVPIAVFGDKFFSNYTKKCNKSLEEKLTSKGFVVVGDFSCPGFNTNVFLKYFGGINKNRPNEEDLRKARDFAKMVKGN